MIRVISVQKSLGFVCIRNLWANNSQAANNVLPQIAQNLTDQDFLCVKIRKETWWCEGKNVFLRLNSFFGKRMTKKAKNSRFELLF